MMALVISSVCDACADEGDDSFGKTVLIAIGKDAPHAIELCEDHMMLILGPVNRLLAEHGRDAVGKRKRRYSKRLVESEPTAPEPVGFDDQVACPKCGKVFKGKLGLAGHSRVHGGG